jgi:hypothetical protein
MTMIKIKGGLKLQGFDRDATIKLASIILISAVQEVHLFLKSSGS